MTDPEPTPEFAHQARLADMLYLLIIVAMQTAWLLISRGDGIVDANALALMFLDLHGHGYDLDLIFFGVNSLIMGLLVW